MENTLSFVGSCKKPVAGIQNFPHKNLVQLIALQCKELVI